MPKKRNPQFKLNEYQNHSSRPSTSGLDASKPSRTVNERLAQLRAEQAPRATVEQRNEISSIANTATLPPHLRSILNMPETAPPLPPLGNRRVARINGRRLPPGPAAPRSWLSTSIHAPASVRANATRQQTRDRPRTFCHLSMLPGAQRLPPRGSLIDQSLKAMAVNWEFVASYEQLNLATLPINWKAALLSYLTVYGPQVTVSSLVTLFLTEDDLDDATGGEKLLMLDFTGLLTSDFTVSELDKFMFPRGIISVVEAMSSASLGSPPLSSIADSWEDEAEAGCSKVPAPLRQARFPDLTRLSLSRPGRAANWKHLLSLTSHLGALTHLSIAYWPAPTLTPNSRTAFIEHKHASIPVSGSHYYNALDEDWAEAASVLKKLSQNTYRLQWLDLEGCPEWLPALVWCDSEDRYHRDRWIDRTFRPSGSLTSFAEESPSTTSRTLPGPEWNGAWAQLHYINIAQGVIPRDVQAVRAVPAGVVAAELLLWLRDAEDSPRDENNTEKINVQAWLHREKEARAVASTVRALRGSAGGRFCLFEHGWTRPVGAAAAILKADKPKS